MAERTASDVPVEIAVLYDNAEHDQRLKAAWGFSCLISGLEKTILFDTGGDDDVLLGNMAALRIDPLDVDAVFVSHWQADHFGGLSGFLARSGRVSVYLPRSAPEEAKALVREAGAELVCIGGFEQVCAGAWSTGELGGAVREHSLLVEYQGDGVLITGCAHPGILNILRHANEAWDRTIRAVVGGLHLAGETSESLRGIVEEMKDLGVRAVAPCHCSGDTAREVFAELYGHSCHRSGVGWRWTPGAVSPGRGEDGAP